MGKNWELRGGPTIGCYWYEDENENISELFKVAYDYSYGFGLVELHNGMCAYRDRDGNLSEEYICAEPYSGGFGRVWLKNGKYAYRDVNGELSKEYRYAESYSNGVGYVRLENGKCAYRDVDGNLFNSREYVIIRRFYEGKVDVYDLEDEVFVSNKLLAFVIKKVKDDTRRFIKLTQTNKQLESVRCDYLEAMEYVLSTAHDIRMKNEQKKKQEEQAKIRRQQEAEEVMHKHDKVLEELNLK